MHTICLSAYYRHFIHVNSCIHSVFQHRIISQLCVKNAQARQLYRAHIAALETLHVLKYKINNIQLATIFFDIYERWYSLNAFQQLASYGHKTQLASSYILSSMILNMHAYSILIGQWKMCSQLLLQVTQLSDCQQKIVE